METRKKLHELIDLVMDLTQEGVFEPAIEIEGCFVAGTGTTNFQLRVSKMADIEYFNAARADRQYDAVSYASQPVTHDNLVRAVTWLKRKHNEAQQRTTGVRCCSCGKELTREV